MPKHADFLVEIQTEELPPKALYSLAESFCENIKKGLSQSQLSFKNAEFFATPRRLAVKVNQLIPKQTDSIIERRGPAWQAAFDEQGRPTSACIGFARSCGITPDKLITIENNQGKWVGHKQTVRGKKIEILMPEIVKQSLNALPIPKKMRWGSNEVEFVRPVHAVLMLYGNKIVPGTILNCKAGRVTNGHRFLCKKQLKITSPEKYAYILEKQGYVIADFSQRKNKIFKEMTALVKRKFLNKAKIKLDDNLLNEVTALVEWPVAVLGQFDQTFLNVPHEVLISAMQDHQRYFPIVDTKNKLISYFVVISNLKSRNIKQVIAGNERVLRARLADAAFFFDKDKKIKLINRVDDLKKIVFQAKLGTLYDKTQRVESLVHRISEKINLDTETLKKAVRLAKADLTTELVGEFPELQGIAGYYYAKHDGENEIVATAIKEHYQPRFSGDQLPSTSLGCAISIADKIDTLVGFFKINLLPTGDKDPFGLRRAATGILRILIEKEIDLDLGGLLNQASLNYEKTSIDEVWNFISNRMESWCQEQHISVDVFRSVIAKNSRKPYDIYNRLLAVQSFKKLKEAEALSIANKRVSNILNQYNKSISQKEIDPSLFEHDSERHLAKLLSEYEVEVKVLVNEKKYQKALTKLTKLREPIDSFFDHVMVMVDDENKRENRLLILTKLRNLFLQVADIALLQP